MTSLTSISDPPKLPSLPLFGLLRPEERAYLQDSLRREVFPRGELILAHSGANLGMLFLEKGRACATMLSGEGREAVVFRLREGDLYILSETCLLRQVSFEAHIEAERDTALLLLPEKTVETVSSSNLEFKCELYRLAALRFSEVLLNLQRMLFERVETRIARFLLEEAALAGDENAPLRLTHEVVAKHVGSAREVVTRTLTRLAAGGAVSLGRGQIQIVNKAGLLALL